MGWDVYNHLDRMAEIPVGTETRSFSSFDRTGGNDDGFTGRYSCISTSSSGCLIASHDGPGEIDSIWFTRQGPNGLGDVSQDGNLVVQLDGHTVVNDPLEALVEGKSNTPFVYPLVADRFQSSGGVYIKVPMPFRQNMRVYTTSNPLFYHLDYRAFSDNVGVSTFSRTDPAGTQALAVLNNAGKADPKPNAPTPPPALPFSILPNQSTTLATEAGPGAISALQLSLDALRPGAQAAPQTAVPASPGHEVSGAVQLPLDPTNQGARLVYQGPPGTTPQSAPQLVDGQPVGSFSSPAPTAGVSQTLDLPPAVTAGKSLASLKNVLLVPGSTITVESLRGGQPVRSDAVHPAPLSGQPATVSSVTPQTTSVLDGLRLQLSFDGQQTVDLPVGEFFASPLDGSPVSSLLTAVQSGALSSWYLMPYASGATVQLYNGTGAIVTGTSSVSTEPSPTWTTALAPGGGSGYFRAQSHQAESTAGADFPLLDQSGGGKLLGVSLAMRGGSPGRAFLEGDERFSLDGYRTPQEQGTGTEDFFEGGWYFSNGLFTAPFNGLVSQQSNTTDCANECLSAYRLFVADSVPFEAGAHLSIEHGSRNDSAANYDATTWLYARTNPSVRVTGSVDLGQPASEASAGFSVQGAAPVGSLQSGFEGPYDTVPVAATDRTGSGTTTFTLPVDPAAAGVTIRRTTDQSVAGQAAEVFVNNTDAGRWSQPLGNTSSRWLEDDFRIPPALTSGSNAITVQVRPAAGSPPWSAARYAILCDGADAADTTAPAFTGVVSTTSLASRPIDLFWTPAADDSPSLHYLVYRSTTPNPTPGSATLVGQTRMTGFVDSAAPPTSTVYYIVVPVDETGNVGQPSPQSVTGTTSRLVLEGESTPVTANAIANPQSMTPFGSGWSGGAQEWLQASGPGAFLSFSVNVPAATTYGLTLALTRAPDYGIATVSVDGRQLGPAFDGYGPTVSPSGPLAFGFASLSAGPHTVTTTVTGHNPASAGYFVGVDYLQLDDVGQGDPIQAKASTLAAGGLDLGSPVGGEQALGPGISQTYQQGRILWSPNTGTHEVHGAIVSHYDTLGGPLSFLGFPTSDETGTPDQVGRFNTFANNGSIYWTSGTGARSVHGLILTKYLSLGGPSSFLGYPTTDETGTPDGVGRFNHFSSTHSLGNVNGSIYWTPSTGASSIHGAIRAKWASLGWELSFLGYPVTDETGTPDGVGRFNHFSNSGSIYWTPSTGAWSVHGVIRSQWASMGWERSCLGYPVSDEFAIPGGRQSNFQRGFISFSFATGVATPSC